MSNQKSVCLLEDGLETVYCWHEHCAMATTAAKPRESSSLRLARPSVSSSPVAPDSMPSELQGAPALEIVTLKMDKSLESSGRASCVSLMTPTSLAGTPYSELSGMDPMGKQTASLTKSTDTLSIVDEPNAQDDIGHLRWQEFSPPKELNIVEDGMAPEILQIFKQSVMEQWQAARASEEIRASQPTQLSRPDTSGGHSTMPPMLANEEVLEQDQPGLQVVTPTEEQHRLSQERNGSSKTRIVDRFSISALSKSSSISGRPGSIRSTTTKSHNETLVPVGPMGKEARHQMDQG